MGEVKVKVKIINFGDIIKASDGIISDKDIREVEVDAVIDTGATYMCLPPGVIEELGLYYSHSVPVFTANGEVMRRIFLGAHITIMERSVEMEVLESDRTTPPLVGFLILEALDFVVDTVGQKLIPNPEHGGRRVANLY